MNTFGSRIRELRNIIGITQEKLCQDLLDIYNYPVNPATLSLYENDKRVPTIELIYHLSRYYNISTDYLIYGKKDNVASIESNIDDIKYFTIKRIMNILEHISLEQLVDLNNYLKTFELDIEIHTINNF